MAIINVNTTDTFDEWRVKTNEISSSLGDAGQLANPGITIAGTEYTNVVACIDALKDGGNIQSDWDQTDTAEDDFINNKPSILQADWNETDTTDAGFINNKPDFALDSGLIALTTVVTSHTSSLNGIGTSADAKTVNSLYGNVALNVSDISAEEIRAKLAEDVLTLSINATNYTVANNLIKVYALNNSGTAVQVHP